MLPKSGVKDSENAARRANNSVLNTPRTLVLANKEPSVNRFIEAVQVLIKPTTGITVYIHIHILRAGQQASQRGKYMDGARNISEAIS